MEKKAVYEDLDMSIITFDVEDVIVTSPFDPNELPDVEDT